MADLLDHGYVRLIESWGSDERIIEAARMSTQKGFNGWGDKYHASQCPNGDLLSSVPLDGPCSDCGRAPGDEKLLKFLWENKGNYALLDTSRRGGS